MISFIDYGFSKPKAIANICSELFIAKNNIYNFTRLKQHRAIFPDINPTFNLYYWKPINLPPKNDADNNTQNLWNSYELHI